MHACQLIAYVALFIGLALNVLVFISFPFATDLEIFIAGIDFAAAINGTLNNALPFQNLRSLRLGNWGACLFDDQTWTSAEQHGILCTQAAPAYAVTLTVDDGDKSTTSTIVAPILTGLLSVHAISFLFHTIAVIPTGQITWTYIALAVDTSMAIYDYVFVLLIRNSLQSEKEISVITGPSPTLALGATILLGIGAIARSKIPPPAKPKEDSGDDGSGNDDD